MGDPDKPKLVFFFDEAHLLFDNAPKALLDAIEQVVRLIRSKGVGVYFVTQNPLDVPETVLGQLGNRVQHALRAFTPRDQKAVRAAAETFRQNPNFDTAKAITELGVGEALVSMLEGKGAPSIVERTLIAPPGARVGPITQAERTPGDAAAARARQIRRGRRRRIPPTRILAKRAAGRAGGAGGGDAASAGGGGILDTARRHAWRRRSPAAARPAPSVNPRMTGKPIARIGARSLGRRSARHHAPASS